MARLTEPFIEFFRYLPAPAFGALAVAVLGIDDAPKVAIIFIGTFFQQVLVVANTTRRLDPALLEAAQTLGAIAPRSCSRGSSCRASITDLYTDMRVLLGWAWTYLIVAELIGVSSRHHLLHQPAGASTAPTTDVFASIILIGLIGLATRPGAGVAGAAALPVAADGAARLVLALVARCSRRGARAARRRGRAGRGRRREAARA